MTADTNLSARLDLARMRYDATETGYALDDLRMLVFGAWQSGQLIPLADAEAMVKSAVWAERDACIVTMQCVMSEFIAQHGTTKTPQRKTAIFYKRKIAAAIRARGVEE